ncbi:hypothetical protein GLW08_20555 [Pontibacillus yanchengensis]|uniref:PrgI family protein n=2 Tax=Pontibacillus yanchengensis TaxID=462910 RepID=A0A6I5A5A6_9BACI|nr:PrgI family protein [Pontibacillus yanchengensis]MYL35497.1 hypothetical protein [Pontibacillus yanchengensis]MYL55697.1 hypothetical protein [Pontibacillus yanchengensis]
MRTKMPFDTEKERKVIKGMSWRQGIYALVAGVIYITITSEIVFSGKFPFMMGFILCLLVLPIIAPLIVFAFLKNKDSGYFLDRHILYVLKHRKAQSGVWRK